VLQGLNAEEAIARQPLAWKIFKARDPAAPLEGGESLGGFARRILDFIEEKMHAHPGGRVLMVTHGGALDAVYRHATGTPAAAVRDFPIYNASVNTLVHRHGKWHIDRWGDISHLPRELAMDDS
jgi:probable phosphoglycerate mutase